MGNSDMDKHFGRPSGGGGVLWLLPGCRGGLLLVYLCQGGQTVLSPGDLAYSGSNVCGQTGGRSSGATGDRHAVDELQAAVLHIRELCVPSNLRDCIVNQLRTRFPTAQVAALLWAFGLPKVEKSVYFHNKTEAIQVAGKSDGGGLEKGSEDTDGKETEPKTVTSPSKKVPAWQLLWSHFRSAYTNSLVVQWSLWYAISLSGFLQITTYMQVVWKSFANEPTVSQLSEQ